MQSESKPLYVLSRRKSPASDIVVFWTGDNKHPWSESTDDAVLFRSKTAAETVARSKRWPIHQEGEWYENSKSVAAHSVELKLSNFVFNIY